MDKEFLFIGLAMTVLGLAGIAMEPLSPTFREGFTALAGLVLAFGVILIPVGILKGGVPTGGTAKAFFALAGIVILAGVEVVAFPSLGAPPATPTTVAPSNITIVLGSASPSNPEFYSPQTFQAKVGQTISWANRDNSVHTVTSNTKMFESGTMSPGDIFTFTFTQPGTYEYFCRFHPWMKGTVIVTG